MAWVEYIMRFVEATAWPLVVLALFVLLRREIRALVQAVASKAKKISAAGVSIELAARHLEQKVLAEAPPDEERVKVLRNVELAKGLAGNFDHWMRSHNHPDQPDSMHLLDWLTHARGAEYVGEDYQLFRDIAEILHGMGYKTLPPPGEPQFLAKLREHDFRMRERLVRG